MSQPFEPGTAVKQYRIVGLIGRGGMGEVYQADDTRLGRKVAIKVLPAALAGDPQRLHRFTQEAKAASALNHPAILTIYDVDEVDGQPFLVTELIEGVTLRERLRASALSLREAIEITTEVAAALAAAHAAGIVHRDVKPENIMLRDDGHAKLVDFGLAKLERDAISSTDVTVAAGAPPTTPGLVLGTTSYMSPEQARGLPVDARSDIFSLGVVLYEMAAGRVPFQGETSSDVIAAILHFEPPAIADLPPDLEHTLQKALEKDRDERHQTAKDLAADLKRLRRRLDPSAGASSGPAGHGAASWTHTPTSGRPSTVVSTPGTTSKQPRRGIAAVAAIAIVAAIAFVGWSYLGREPETSGGASVGQPGGVSIERVSGLGSVRNPMISPDGKTLAYIKTEGAENAIWLRQMATGSVVRVVGPSQNNFGNVQFTPDGNFLYYNENATSRPIRYTLMAVPAFGGTAKEIAQGRFLRPSFSPDGKRVATRREVATAFEIVVMNADGTGDVSVIATRPREIPPYTAPRWSPSGTYLAMIVSALEKDGIKAKIQIMRPDGSDIRIVTPAIPMLWGDLVWGSSDDELVAIGTKAIGAPTQIFRIRTSDGRVEPITQDTNIYSGLSFSAANGVIATVQNARLGSIWVGPADRPDDARELPGRLGENDGYGGLDWLNDRELVFVRETDTASLWAMNADGTGARRLTERMTSVAPRAGPDGRQVIFESDRDTLGSPQLFRITIPEGRVTRLSHEGAATGGMLSPDGGTVIFKQFPNIPGRLLRIAPGATSPATIFEAPALIDHALSPDGMQVAVITNAGVGTPRTISLVPAGGGEARTIFTTAAAPSYLRWYPAGNALLLISEENRQTNVFRLDLAGGPPRRLTNLTRGSVRSPVISPDGRRMAYHRGTVETDIVLIKPKAEN